MALVSYLHLGGRFSFLRDFEPLYVSERAVGERVPFTLDGDGDWASDDSLLARGRGVEGTELD